MGDRHRIAASAPIHPPAFLRPRRWMLVVLLIAIPLALIAGYRLSRVAGTWSMSGWFPWVLALVPAVITNVCGVIYTRRSARAKAERRVNAGELPCWYCGYDLSAHAPRDTCPECGESFDASMLRRRWIDFFTQ